MNDIWFLLSSSVPSSLWLLRNETIHEDIKYTPPQARIKIVATTLAQLRGVAEHRRRSIGQRMRGVCMLQCLEALERVQSSRDQRPRPRLTIHFDSGAGGNPGPGGSGWALTMPTQTATDCSNVAARTTAPNQQTTAASLLA